MSEQLPNVVHIADKQEQNELLENNELIEDNPSLALQLKVSGNDHFQKGEFLEAIKDYQLALRYCGPQSQKLSALLHSNTAIALIKMQNNVEAIESCRKALKQDPSNLKAQTNLAICQQKIDKIEESLESYKAALKLSKTDEYLLSKVRSLEKKVAVLSDKKKEELANEKRKQEQLDEKTKEEVLTGLKGIGNSLLGFFGMSLDNFKMEQGPSGGYTISTKKSD